MLDMNELGARTFLMKGWDQGLGIVGLIVLASALALTLSIGVPIITASEAVKLSDWLGFAGNVLGSGSALLAATIAWRAVQRQIAVQREQLLLTALLREEERLEAQFGGSYRMATYLNSIWHVATHVKDNGPSDLKMDQVYEEIDKVCEGVRVAADVHSVIDKRLGPAPIPAKFQAAVAVQAILLPMSILSHLRMQGVKIYDANFLQMCKEEIKELKTTAESLFSQFHDETQRMVQVRARIHTLLDPRI